MKIVQTGTYNGAYFSNPINMKKIIDYEKTTKEHLDIVAIDHEFKNGFDFPLKQCEAIAYDKRTPFIKLLPWSAPDITSYSYDLDKINNEDIDNGIRRFAQGAKKFAKPVFISFCPGINDNCSCGDSALKYKKAYSHIADIFKQEGVSNVTWVWEVNAAKLAFKDYYPGNFIDRICIKENHGN